ncbi:MAG: AraC family transcriptional regulator ligand-binding domain-containing protein [Gammaproteobacteria bacterium]|nr:AraC family transcriptional regulator ligand-binding domain-containing protein [Gammaproteobacteria bacterium]MBI5615497.1 AraC family transcriptional regulator ligand-binding domain-containing protein [Gammaproteobacteria bacterium]
MPPVSDSLMPASYVRVMARTTPDVVRLLAGTGLTPAMLLEKHTVTVAQQLICVRNSLSMMRRPDWHLAWAKHCAERFHGPVSAAWQCAPTLGEGVETFARFMPKRIPYLSWRNTVEGLYWTLAVAPRMALGELSEILVELPLLSLVSYLSAMRPADVRAVVVELVHEPLVPPAVYRRWFKCSFRFEALRNAVTLPAHWCEVANVDYDACVWELALRRCREAEDEQRGEAGATASTAAAVSVRLHEGLVRQRVDHRLPCLEEMAEALHLSPRTLSRRLAAERTSYQMLLDRVRKPLAQDLLLRGLRIGEVANLLGYASPSSFDRAFVRWFGAAPRDLRAARGAGTAPGAGGTP